MTRLPEWVPGRYVRAAVGSAMLVASPILYFRHAGAVAWPDVALHGLLIVGGLLMIDSRIGNEIRDIVKAWRSPKE
jgi:hypothetical protein